MISDVRSLGFVSTDDSYIVEIALFPSFIDHRVTACPKLLIQDEVLHPLWIRNKGPKIIINAHFKKLSKEEKRGREKEYGL